MIILPTILKLFSVPKEKIQLKFNSEFHYLLNAHVKCLHLDNANILLQNIIKITIFIFYIKFKFNFSI